MKSLCWRRWLQTVFGAKQARRAMEGRPRRRMLGLEALEDRTVPSGTPAMVLDINSGAMSSDPSQMVAVGSITYFTADDGVNGVELWKSDGTVAGTVMVKDINPGSVSSAPASLTNVNGTLFFTANDGTTGRELWKSDGITAGTVLVKNINLLGNSYPQRLTNVNGTLFFTDEEGVNGLELWKSDGTAAGTVLVKDIRPGSGGSNPDWLTNVNGTLFFSANDGTNGWELWKSDGTAAGTVLVKDINPGGHSSYPGNLTNVNGTLFFSARQQLWKSDGTAAGTVLVKDIINPSSAFFSPDSLTNVNGTLFFTAWDDTTGNELWKSDGTETGTTLVKDIYPGIGWWYGDYAYSSNPANLTTNITGTLFFTAFDPTAGNELWKSDGTEAGTTLVKEIMPGWAGSYPTNLTNVNGTLFFTADDGSYKLWQSDGTETGTVLVANLSASRLTNVNGTLFFAANDGVHGQELWMLALDPDEPPKLTITDVSLPEGNAGPSTALFTVQLSAASSETVTVRYATADGSATAGSASADSDYQAASGVLTFAPGERTKTIPVLINGDALVEANETFLINLSEATGATTFDGQAIGTILDDEPRISIGDMSRSEGNTGQTAFTFTVSLSAPSTGVVSVDYTTAGASAVSGSDYVAVSGTLSFAPGETSKTITVPIIADRTPESNETFVVNLSNPAYATIADGQGVGTIIDDEPRVSISDVSNSEGKKGKTTLFTFTVTLSAAYDQPVAMSFRTVNGTATTSNSDYIAKTGTLTFAPGETTKTITVEVKGDSKKEASETFYLDLFGLSSNALFTKNRGIGTILNDD